MKASALGLFSDLEPTPMGTYEVDRVGPNCDRGE